jgi:diguanylate cyclase (GGDEF)-like protein
MNAKKKISYVLSFLFIALFLFMIANIGVNIRNFGLKNAESKARLTADIVKDALTAHMVNGIMDSRGFFLDQIQNSRNIQKVWLVRAPSVIKQYGKGFNNETPRDDIDKEVIKSGKMKKVIDENLLSSAFRITIPYIATQKGELNCLGCHDAKEGDTLGAISMIMDISDIRDSGLSSVLSVGIVAIIILILIQFVVNGFINPYIMLFDSIKTVMEKAQNGNYGNKVVTTNSKESQEVALWINNLLEKLQKVFKEMESKIDIFLTHKEKDKKTDPLLEVNSTINQLSEIYKFKKTIERDEELSDVYKRLAYILKEKFEFDDFIFLEADTTNKTNKIVHIEKTLHCKAEKNNCRADRTNMIVDSCMFADVCNLFKDKDMDYLCIPYSISNDMDFIISIVTQDKEETKRVRKLIPNIQDYVDTAKPEIVSKKLMQILQESARIDQLTGMYNRKYLEEFIEKAIPQAKRAGISFGVLMIDIDYFKMINDTYGHDIGDEAIRVISKVIKDSIRSSDVAIRYGGEEFLVLLYNCKKEAISLVAEKIRIEFAKQKIQAANEAFTKTLSVGASIFPEDSDSIWKCIKFADIALYNAKENGRNRVVIFDTSMIKDGSFEESY